jgi:hypothetical protein
MSQNRPQLNSSSLFNFINKEYRILLGLKMSSEKSFEYIYDYYSNLKEDEFDLFWLVFAYVQLKTCSLIQVVKDKAIEIIESDREIKRWIDMIPIGEYIKSNRLSFRDLNYFTTNKRNIGLFSKSEDDLNEDDRFSIRLTQDIFTDDTVHRLKEFYKIPDNYEPPINPLPDFMMNWLNNSEKENHIWAYNHPRKNVQIRQEILQELKRDLIEYHPCTKNIPKPVLFKSNWKVGDIYSLQINIDKTEYLPNIKVESYLGKYLYFRVVHIKLEPVSQIIKNEYIAESQVNIAFFDYISDNIENPIDFSQLKYLEPLKMDWFGKKMDAPNIYLIFLKHASKSFKKMGFHKIQSDDDFYKNLPQCLVGRREVWILSISLDQLPYFFIRDFVRNLGIIN